MKNLGTEDLANILKAKGLNVLFLHRNFPAQFRYLIIDLIKNPLNLLMFITSNSGFDMPGVNKLIYKIEKKNSEGCHPYLKTYEEALRHGKAAADIALAMKKRGIKPDIIYGHSWGPPMFMKDVFPDVPLLCYFEWFNNVEGSNIGFDGIIPNEDQKAKIICNNSVLLSDLCSCDAGITPTNWQKQQFPKEFHNKIKVLHDGVDTEACKPDKDAKLTINVDGKTLEFTSKDEVITYATRGMEPYRGFPEFMKAVEKLLVKRPNAHFIIAGEDVVCYGTKIEGSYKDLMLKNLKIDMNRVHFVGTLPLTKYIELLQISSVHVYLTFPFILSWSILDAMSCGCCIVASNTPPILEVIEDNYNGLLVDFYNIDQLVEKIEYALDNKDKILDIKSNARQTVLDKYNLKKLLPQHIEFIRSLTGK